jgi:hypothetical protein
VADELEQPLFRYRRGFTDGTDPSKPRPRLADEHWLAGFDDGRLALHRAAIQYELQLVDADRARARAAGELPSRLGPISAAPTRARQAVASAIALARSTRPPPAFTCPRCGLSSWNESDRTYGWCARCREVTGGDRATQEPAR